MADTAAITVQLRDQDLRGSRFGRWTVISFAEKREKPSRDRWLCRCDCGNEKAVAQRELMNGDSKSCGCLRREMTRDRFLKGPIGHSPIKGHSLEYNSYIGMIARCTNHSHKDYRLYGAIGRSVCDRWLTGEEGKSGFDCFLLDMGARPPDLTLDRINNSGNYEPGNCRWATKQEQARNR